MTKGRGFTRFEAFDKFLFALYRNRRPGRTVAELYTQTVERFEKNNRDV